MYVNLCNLQLKPHYIAYQQSVQQDQSKIYCRGPWGLPGQSVPVFKGPQNQWGPHGSRDSKVKLRLNLLSGLPECPVILVHMVLLEQRTKKRPHNCWTKYDNSGHSELCNVVHPFSCGIMIIPFRAFCSFKHVFFGVLRLLRLSLYALC